MESPHTQTEYPLPAHELAAALADDNMRLKAELAALRKVAEAAQDMGCYACADTFSVKAMRAALAEWEEVKP